MYLKEELYELIKTDESIFDFIQDSALDGLWYWDLENPENEWMNAKFWKVLGYHSDEMPQKSASWQGIINQDDLKIASDNFTRHCENPNHPYDQIVRYTHKNGTTVWIRCRGMAIRDKDGKPIRMLGAHQDVTELKRSEQELVKTSIKVLESEEKYRAFYNNAPLSYQSLDENGCFIDINPMWSKTLGYERDEVIGKWFGDFLHPDYVEHFRINFPAFKKRGYVSDIQFKLRRKDNTYIYVSFEGCVGYTPEGKFRQTYCVFKDITEQKALENTIKKAKEKAEESEEKFKAIVENGSVLLTLTDAHGRVEFASPQCEKVIGWKEEDIIGVSMPDFIHPDDKLRVAAEREKATSLQPIKDFEYRIIDKKKKTRWISHSAALIKKGDAYSVLSTITNITERKRAEEALRESEEKLKSIFINMTDVVWSISWPDLTHNYISPSLEKLYGRSKQELLDSPNLFQDITHPDDKHLTEKAIKQLLEEGKAERECRIIKPDGSIIWVNDRSKMIYDENQLPIRVDGVTRDITERKQAEEALREEKAFQGTLLDLTKSFLNISLVDFDTVIEDMLGKAGDFSKVDRVYLFLHDHLRRVTSNSHEWCKEGITPEKENLQEIPFDFFSDMLDAWEKGEMVHIPSVAQMPEEHAMRAILENQGIQSLILIPLNQGTENIGFIGFDVVNQCKSFTEQEVALLLVMAEIISNAFTRKRAEEALKESESQFRLLFECAADAIFIADAESGILVNANNTAVNLLNISIDEIIGKHQSELHPPEMSNYSKATFQKHKVEITEEKLANSVEIFVLRSDGTQIPVEITGSRVLYKGRNCIMGIFRDITERKQAEEALSQREERLQRQNESLLVLVSHGTLFQTDLQRAVAEITEACSELLGTERVSVWLYNDDFSEINCINLYDGTARQHINNGNTLRCEEFPTYFACQRMGEVIDAVDVYTDPRTCELPAAYYKEHNIRSMMDTPVWFHNRLGAVLCFEHTGEQRVWTSEDVILATSMAALLSLCFQNEERKQAEEELHKSNERLETLLEISQKVTSTIDQDTILQMLVNNAIRLIGLDTGAIYLKNDDETIRLSVTTPALPNNFPDDLRNAYLKNHPHLNKALQTGKQVLMKDTLSAQLTSDEKKIVDLRELRTIVYQPIMIREKPIGALILSSIETPRIFTNNDLKLLQAFANQAAHIIDNVNNYSRTKQSEIQLRKLSQAIEQSPAMVVITNLNGDIEYVNPIFSEVTGYTFEEAIGQNPRILKSGELPAEVHKELWETITAGNIWKGELHNKKKNGDLFWEAASISSITNSEGEITHFLAVKEDITKKKLIEQELIAAKEKAEEADKLKTAFINNISHEIRTPLNGILGFGQVLAESDLSKEERRGYFEHVEKAGNRLMNTVNDYMDIALLVSDALEVTKKDFALEAVFGKITEKAKKLCAGKNIEFKLEIPKEAIGLTVHSDPEFIQKILDKLLENAIKFTNAGGIICGCQIKTEHLSFFVKDTGCGIDNNKLDLIFELFKQADTAITRGHEGSGLGLTIAKGLVTLLGGEIAVVSENGKGSVFSFTIPLTNAGISLSPDETATTKPQNPEKSLILIAEDDESNYEYLAIVIESSGYKYIHAANGRDAVDFCRQNPEISLVLMDIKMPVMHGDEATRQIRTFLPELPIIATTAHAQTGDEHRFLEAGCNEYISKPIKKDKLLEIIRKYIE